MRRAGLPNIRFHNLRHTCATLLLAKGVHPKIVSEMLECPSIYITLGIYGHVVPGMQEAAASAMEAALGDDPHVRGVGGAGDDGAQYRPPECVSRCITKAAG